LYGSDLLPNNLYKKYLGFIMRPNPNWTVAIIFLPPLSCRTGYIFCNPSCTSKGKLEICLFLPEMFFGLITYATMILQTWQRFKDWPVLITVIDLIWGTTLGGLVSIITWWIVTKIG